MIGVFVSNKKFLKMCEMAAERFNHFTGLPYMIIRVNSEKPYVNKLRIHEYIPDSQTAVVIDSDLFFVRKTDLTEFSSRKEFIAAKDPMHKNGEDCIFVKDCRLHGMNREIFFNSGLFIFNGEHKQIMKEAEAYSYKLKVNDFGEQSVLNLAVQRSGVDIHFLDQRYNSLAPMEKKKKKSELDSIAIHAAGVKGPEEKLKFLQSQSRKYKHYE